MAFTGRLTPTTVFDGMNLISCLHAVHQLDICMKKFYPKKIIFDKITAGGGGGGGGGGGWVGGGGGTPW